MRLICPTRSPFSGRLSSRRRRFNVNGFRTSPVSSIGSILRAPDSLSSSVEPDDATLIGAKVHCEVSVPGTFLTETMDLEAIAASAREAAATTSATLSGITYAHHLSAPETVKEEIIAEVSAVAEEFVAEQQHHAQPQPAHAVTSEPPKDRRRKRRALISAPIRVRSMSAARGSDEIATTLDVSRTGILFHSPLNAYTRGMEVAVIFPFSQAPGAINIEQTGQVVRVTDLGNGLRAVAVALYAADEEEVTVGRAPACATEPARDSVLPRRKRKTRWSSPWTPMKRCATRSRSICRTKATTSLL